MQDICFIVNKISGTDHQKRFHHLVEKHLDHTRFRHQWVYTEYSGHGTGLAKRAVAGGTKIIVAVGGDGSINEVASGIVGTGAILGVIPKGSGNGLARALHIPRNTAAAIRLINRGTVRKIDVGFANGYVFLSNAGVGFDALIAKKFSESKQRGFIHYARLIATTYSQYRPEEYLLTIDGKEIREKAFFINVANGNQLGYEFKVSPKALPDDGILDVCLMKPVSLISMGAVSIQSFLGDNFSGKYARQFRGTTIDISGEHLNWMQIDGDAMEVVGNNKVSIRLRPQGMPVICPLVHSK
jgi:diacylglycerol kinase (ATP)